MSCKYLVDTNIIIYYLNGDHKAIDFIDKNLDDIAISSITYLEVLVFSYNQEEDARVRAFLELFTIYDVLRTTIDIAINTYRNKKIKMADNLIAATAKQYEILLITRNIDDFKNIDIDIYNIYD